MSSFEEKDFTVCENIKSKDAELVSTLEKRVAHVVERTSLFAEEMDSKVDGDYHLTY